MSDFERGQWDAFTRVLHLLNTFDLKLVEKGEIYDLVMEMRPREEQNNETDDRPPQGPEHAQGKDGRTGRACVHEGHP